ncbi:MAG: hypothetical protein AB7S38_17985 [Vulcanimicrobiota bacterium]
MVIRPAQSPPVARLRTASATAPGDRFTPCSPEEPGLIPPGLVAPKDPELARQEAATGFPDLQLVSHRMLDHVRDSLKAAAKETGIPVLYAGYDPYCSVGRGLALPKSDVDFLHIIIADGQDKERFFASFQQALAKEPLVDLQGIQAQQAVFGLDELDPTPIGDNPRPKWEQLMTKLLSRSLHGADGRGQLLADPAWAAELRQRVPASLDSQDQKVMLAMPAKPKHEARLPLAEAYPGLSRAEQKMVWRIIDNDPDEVDMSFLDLTADNPNLPIIESLADKGLLVKVETGDPVYQASVAKWRHTFRDSPAWLEELNKMDARPPRLVALWRISHQDDPIVGEMFFPDLQAQRDRARQV